jgi:hypothetical protein
VPNNASLPVSNASDLPSLSAPTPSLDYSFGVCNNQNYSFDVVNLYDSISLIIYLFQFKLVVDFFSLSVNSE